MMYIHLSATEDTCFFAESSFGFRWRSTTTYGSKTHSLIMVKQKQKMLGMSASWGERYDIIRIMNVDLERAKVYLNRVIRCFVMYYTYWYGRVRPIPTYRVCKFYDKTWNDKGSLSDNFNRASSWNVGKITFFWNEVVRKRTIIISLPQEQLRNLCIQYSKQLIWWLAASILINFCSMGIYFTTIKNIPKISSSCYVHHHQNL